MINVGDDKIMIFDESVYDVEDFKRKIKMVSQLYKIPMENIIADRNTLKTIFVKGTDDLESEWLHHARDEENESR